VDSLKKHRFYREDALDLSMDVDVDAVDVHYDIMQRRGDIEKMADHLQARLEFIRYKYVYFKSTLLFQITEMSDFFQKG